MRLAAIQVALLVLANPVSAEHQPRLERLEVAIWPEYDQPAVLVMYRAWLEEVEPLPATVALPMPAAVAAPSAVAKRAPDGTLLVAPYSVEIGEAWNQVQLYTDQREVRLEYYVDLTTTAAQRRYLFEWPGGPEVASAAYEVMQPLGGRDFAVTPRSGPPQLAGDGLLYQREELGPIASSGNFVIDIAYSKDTPALTAAPPQPAVQQPVQPGAPETGPARGEPSTADGAAQAPSASIWPVVALVLAVGAVGGLWLWLSTGRSRRS